MAIGLTRIEPRYEPREVVWAEFKFTPEKPKESHPVLVISKYSINPFYPYFICIPITSANYDEAYAEKINEGDMDEGEFKKPSQVICQIFHMILKEDAKKRKGKVSIQFYNKILRRLKKDILEI